MPPSVETCKKPFALRARALRGVQKVAKWISRDGWRWASPRRYRARGTAPPGRALADAEMKIPRACAPGRSGPPDASAGGPLGDARRPQGHCAIAQPCNRGPLDGGAGRAPLDLRVKEPRRLLAFAPKRPPREQSCLNCLQCAPTRRAPRDRAPRAARIATRPLHVRPGGVTRATTSFARHG